MSALLYTDHAMRRRYGHSISDDAINQHWIWAPLLESWIYGLPLGSAVSR